MKKQLDILLNHAHVKLNGKALGALGPEVAMYMADSRDIRMITQMSALCVIV